MDDAFDRIAQALFGTKEQEIPSRPSSRPPPPASHRIVPIARAVDLRPKLRVSENGSWFELPDGTRAGCGHDPVLQSVLERLAHARATRPGTAIPTKELVAATWSGERLSPAVATERVRHALDALRTLGLGALLLERIDGHLLDPTMDFALALAGRQPRKENA